MTIDIPETYTVDQQIKHDLNDLIAHVSISVHGLQQDILLQKLKWLKTEVEEYIDVKERESEKPNIELPDDHIFSTKNMIEMQDSLDKLTIRKS